MLMSLAQTVDAGRFPGGAAGEQDQRHAAGPLPLEHRMDGAWNDSQPIYRQLRDRVVAMILDGALNEGDPLPSVRTVAAELRVNPLTVLKGYQQLVDERLVEKRRGLGMFITAGARDLLLQGERQKFLAEQWPRIQATIQRLGLRLDDLLAPAASAAAPPAASPKAPAPASASASASLPPDDGGSSAADRSGEER